MMTSLRLYGNKIENRNNTEINHSDGRNWIKIWNYKSPLENNNNFSLKSVSSKIYLMGSKVQNEILLKADIKIRRV